MHTKMKPGQVSTEELVALHKTLYGKPRREPLDIIVGYYDLDDWLKAGADPEHIKVVVPADNADGFIICSAEEAKHMLGEDEWDRIANEAITKAEKVTATPREFYDGLGDIIEQLQDRRLIAKYEYKLSDSDG